MVDRNEKGREGWVGLGGVREVGGVGRSKRGGWGWEEWKK